MLSTRTFGKELKELGFDFYSGVPCSFLKYLINYAINDCNYVMAANEGDAVAICAGAQLGGHKSVFLCQNSGLTNATSPLTSLVHTFEIPVLGFVSLRGEAGLSDEPQHELMGQITTGMLDLMGIEWAFLADDIERAREQIRTANACIEQNRPFFFVVKKGTFDEEPLEQQELKAAVNSDMTHKEYDDELPTRYDALSVLNRLKNNDTLLLATTGKTGRELYTVEDAANNLYMVGSMGCISSLGLGLASARPDKKVMVIDGDGSILMRMGAMATAAYYGPRNMLHILFDNNIHDSTGGQATISHNIDFISVAASMGYEKVFYVHNLEELEARVCDWQSDGGLTFLYLKIQKGSIKNLGRPETKPPQVAERIRAFIER